MKNIFTSALAVFLSAAVLMSGSQARAGGAIPSNVIVFFAGTSCPAGWTEYTTLRGRYVVGTPAGGTAAGTNGGSALSNMEARTHAHTDPSHAHSLGGNGDHWHGIGADGSHSHSITSAGSHNHVQVGGAVKSNSADPWNDVPLGEQGFSTSSNGSHSHGGGTGSGGSHSHGGGTGWSSTGTHNHGGATGAGGGAAMGSATTMAPYIQLLACRSN